VVELLPLGRVRRCQLQGALDDAELLGAHPGRAAQPQPLADRAQGNPGHVGQRHQSRVRVVDRLLRLDRDARRGRVDEEHLAGRGLHQQPVRERAERHRGLGAGQPAAGHPKTARRARVRQGHREHALAAQHRQHPAVHQLRGAELRERRRRHRDRGQVGDRGHRAADLGQHRALLQQPEPAAAQ
jgi:hypothetical protein